MNIFEACKENIPSFYNKHLRLSGMDEESLALLLPILQERKQSYLLVVREEAEARRVLEILSSRVQEAERILYFPAQDFVPFELVAKSGEISRQRAFVLAKLQEVAFPIIVASVRALEDALLPVDKYIEGIFSLSVGMEYERERLLKNLVALGYRQDGITDRVGTFSSHGGIVDIFSPQLEKPIRVEFFDDEIETLRFFDPQTQRSIATVDSICIYPAKEIFFSNLSNLSPRVEDALCMVLQNATAKERESLQKKVQPILQSLRNGDVSDERLRCLLTYVYSDIGQLIDYFKDAVCWLLSDVKTIEHQLEQISEERKAHFSMLKEEGLLLPGERELFIQAEDFAQRLSQHAGIGCSLLEGRSRFFSFDVTANLHMEALYAYHNDMPRLQGDLSYWIENDATKLFLFYRSEEEKASLQAFFETALEGRIKERCKYIEQDLSIAVYWKDQHMVFLSYDKIFQRKQRRRNYNFDDETTLAYDSIDALQPGDFVVHEQHGIGLYQGIERISIGDESKDYLKLHYRGTAQLLIPVDQLDRVRKYLGDQTRTPQLSKLGSGEWARTKKKVRGAVEDLARKLLAIHAEREAKPGHAFSHYAEDEALFAASFPYVETPDQLQAIQDVTKDMERSVPMDRLVCGDVGYGKTEVAIRAAYKAVLDHKQVAVLVPTTVLAQQHFRTMRDRFSAFGVEVAVLSRFTPAAEEKAILERLKNHQIDVIIGTHKLLNERIVFSDLGLLVVDEEQRFGVAHKERMKAIKPNVDVLTLSATPIPRTLHFSLLGIRDMSLIETPPVNRYPIQTYVTESHDAVIVEACKRELARGGQVFLVQNRITGLHAIARMLEEALPNARILVAHGRLSENRLEETMMAFVAHEADILVCTTIIETGLDIANANTMIALDADKMGLAQLYQLRGRVGRSERLAYAYLLYNAQKTLSTDAEARLLALKEYTALGSGYKIAMQDLKLRGAGDLLGAEQSGHVTAVGYEMYIQLLKEAVQRLSGDEEERRSVDLDLRVRAFFPEAYISDEKVRLSLYQRLQNVQDEEALRNLFKECQDRFGQAPDEVAMLFSVVLVKRLAEKARILNVKQKKEHVYISFYDDVREDLVYALPNLIKQYPNLSLDNKRGSLEFIWRLPKRGWNQEAINQFIAFLRLL